MKKDEVETTLSSLRDARVHAIAAGFDVHFISELEHLIATAEANS